MEKIKVMSVFGTRPEAIKMAPLVKKLASYDEISSLVCVTGQHREMLDQVLSAFEITPDFDLDIMEKSQTLYGVTSKVLSGLQKVFEENRPDIVLVHGDTTTSFAAALAAFYGRIKVGHVEAGLRSFDKNSPYPEEMNRVLTGRLADIHFAPTASNDRNLFNEGIKEHVYVTGNTVIDAIKSTVRKDYVFECPQLNDIDYDVPVYVPIEFDIDVVPQKENPYQRETQNSTILSLWGSGFFLSGKEDEALTALKNMSFDGKEKLIQDIEERSVLQQQLMSMQQQIEQLSGQVNAYKSSAQSYTQSTVPLMPSSSDEFYNNIIDSVPAFGGDA